MSGAKRAAGLVIYKQKDVTSVVEWLLMQTSYGQHHWTPPKGHLDPGEDDMTAALRETKEEAGLDQHQLTIFTDVKEELRYWYKDSPDYSRPFFSCIGKKLKLYSISSFVNLKYFQSYDRYEAFGKPKIVTYWLAKLNNPEDKVILSDEHQDCKWLQLEEACDLSGFPDMANVLKNFQKKVETF